MAVCLRLTGSMWTNIELKLTSLNTRPTVHLTWRMSTVASYRLRALHYSGT
jgi:hypothetical protein